MKKHKLPLFYTSFGKIKIGHFPPLVRVPFVIASKIIIIKKYMFIERFHMME